MDGRRYSLKGSDCVSMCECKMYNKSKVVISTIEFMHVSKSEVADIDITRLQQLDQTELCILQTVANLHV